jgi:transcriptional regulator with XRE-family HTH domain
MADKSKFPVQNHFIELLKNAVPAKFSLAEALAELLNVSIDSAYRRLRGETSVSIDEAYLICKKYNIPLENILSIDHGSAQFNFLPLIQNEDNLELYLKGLLQSLKALKEFPESKIIYAAAEVPIFHSLSYPLLAEFKLFYWSKSLLMVDRLQNVHFKTGLIKPEFLSLSKAIHDLYLQIPSIEIWNHQTILTNISQIEFYWESGQFEDKETTLRLIQQLQMMTDELKKFSDSGYKSLDAYYQLYQSDLIIGSNCINGYYGQNQVSYISFNTMNSLKTTHSRFIQETDKWIWNMIKKANLISGVSEKERYKFFDGMYHAMDSLRQKVDKH